VKEIARGRADSDQQRIIALRPLDACDDLWQGLMRLRDATERLAPNLHQAIAAATGVLGSTV